MAKRHYDALGIQEGASNPSGIAHSILDACQEIREEGGGTQDICDDAAVRLMVHQLAWITKVRQIEDSMTTYDTLLKTCEERQPQPTR